MRSYFRAASKRCSTESTVMFGSHLRKTSAILLSVLTSRLDNKGVLGQHHLALRQKGGIAWEGKGAFLNFGSPKALLTC